MSPFGKVIHCGVERNSAWSGVPCSVLQTTLVCISLFKVSIMGLNGAACLAACCGCMLIFFTFLIPYQFCSMQCKVLHFKLVMDESYFCMKISQAVFFFFLFLKLAAVPITIL